MQEQRRLRADERVWCNSCYALLQVCHGAHRKVLRIMSMSHQFASVEPKRADIDASKGPLVLEFGTPWCGYCRAAQPLVAHAFEPHPEVEHLKVEDGPGRPLGRSFRIKLWPTLVFLRDGREVERLVRPDDAGAIEQALGRVKAG